MSPNLCQLSRLWISEFPTKMHNALSSKVQKAKFSSPLHFPLEMMMPSVSKTYWELGGGGVPWCNGCSVRFDLHGPSGKSNVVSLYLPMLWVFAWISHPLRDLIAFCYCKVTSIYENLRRDPSIPKLGVNKTKETTWKNTRPQSVDPGHKCATWRPPALSWLTLSHKAQCRSFA